MKIKCAMISLLLLCLLCGCSFAGSNKPKAYSKKIEAMLKATEEQHAGEAVEIFKTMTPAELDNFVDFLENYPEELAPIYYIFVADHIYKTDKDKAMLWYYIGKLRAYQDVMMCKDTSARGQLGMYPFLAENTIKYTAEKLDDVNYTIKILQASLDWDDAHPERVSPIWACYHGIEVFYKSPTPELLPEEEFPKIRAEVRAQVQKAIDNRKNEKFVKKLKKEAKQIRNSL